MAHSTYKGLAANITKPSPVAITSSTNATPIVVTTTGVHGCSPDDHVAIYSHLVNTAANGVWRVLTPTATTLTLVTSVGNGVGGATGFAQSLDLGTTDMVTDANKPTAAEFTVPDACALDRTAFLWRAMGWDLEIFPGGNIHLSSGCTLTTGATATVTFSCPVVSNNQTTCTGAGANPGIGAIGGPSGAPGVLAIGTAGGNGVTGTGQGSGAGIMGTGGGSAGSGVEGFGTGGGNGGEFTGQGPGNGLIAVGGATGIGITCAAGGGTAVALSIGAGHARLTGTQPAKTADPGDNNLLAGTNVPKAWGYLVLNGAGGVTNEDGFNVATVTIGASAASGGTGDSAVVVTFARAMANANYSVALAEDSAIEQPLLWKLHIEAKTTGSFKIAVVSIGTSAGFAYSDTPTLSIRDFGVSFQVFGRQ
jgi:hypothetical protein